MTLFGIIAAIFVMGLVVYYLIQKRAPETTKTEEGGSESSPPEMPEM